MVNGANTIADDINVELDRQIDQLNGIQNTVKETQVIIQRANEYIKYFAKQLYTDKILMCLMLLVTIGIVVMIVLKVTGTASTTGIGTDSITST